MALRKIKFMPGEYYHIYNRGVDKRKIFGDKKDLGRFLKSMHFFNSKEPIGSLFEHSFVKDEIEKPELVNFIAYCLNPNHYHFLLTPLVESGVEKFMQRLGTGYSMYFNERNKRSGALFQGKFKAQHIDTNEYLLRCASYVNLNNTDGKGKSKFPLSASSWEEYAEAKDGFCDKSIIIEQFRSLKEYEKFAIESWKNSLARKEQVEELEFASLGGKASKLRH